jgi:PPOX class probable F420-dependent enzyme
MMRKAGRPGVCALLIAGCCACLAPRPERPAAPPAAAHARQHVVTRGAIPPEFTDLLTTKRAFAELATVGRNGRPQVTPVWFDFDGQHIRINSARGRLKDRNMRRDPHVALAIVDPDDPYRYLEIRGVVIEITENGAVEHTNRLAKKYLGVDANPNRRPDQVRVMYVIEPRLVAGQR